MISEPAPTIQGSQGHGVSSWEAEHDECWVKPSTMNAGWCSALLLFILPWTHMAVTTTEQSSLLSLI